MEACVCTTCQREKAPIGRSVAAEAASSYCTLSGECDGYLRDPIPSRNWPGEVDERDGYGGRVRPGSGDGGHE